MPPLRQTTFALSIIFKPKKNKQKWKSQKNATAAPLLNKQSTHLQVFVPAAITARALVAHAAALAALKTTCGEKPRFLSAI